MKQPQISEAEWQVMDIIWEEHPITANRVCEKLADTKWNPRTIRTMLNRLIKKECLRYEIEGKSYLYEPAISRDQCVRQASRSFLNRVFSGNPADLLVHFVRHADLSEADIKELKKILAKKKD